MDVSLIKSLLTLSCNTNVSNRGKIMYSEGSVIVDKLTIQNTFLSISAKVQGSEMSPYKVRIKIRNGRLENSSCSCPYDWSGICKHTAAVMHYIIAYLTARHNDELKRMIQPASELASRNTKEPLKIVFNPDSDDHLIEINEYASYEKIGQAQSIRWRHDISFSVRKNQLVALIDEGSKYNSSNPVQVIFTATDDLRHIYVKSLPGKKVKQLSVEEILAINNGLASGVFSVIPLLNPKNREKKLLAEAADYGIDNLQDAKKYFEIDLDPYADDHVTIKGGLPPLLRQGERMLDLSFINEAYSPELIYDTNPEEHQEKRNLLFYIDQMYEPDIGYEHLAINAFVGRLKKTGELYASGITKYHELSPANQYLSDPDEMELIKLTTATMPKVLQKKVQKKLKTLPPNFPAFQLYLRENFDLIKRFWATASRNKLGVYCLCQDEMYQPYNWKMKPNDLEGPYICDTGMQIVPELDKEDDIYRLNLTVKTEGKSYPIFSSSVEFIHILMLRVNDKLFLVNTIREAILLASFMDPDNAFASVESLLPQLLENIVKPLSKYCTVDIKSLPESIGYKKIEPSHFSKAIYLKEQDQMISFTPVVKYDDVTINLLDRGSCLEFSDNQLTAIVRNTREEKQFLDFLTESHARFSENLHQEYFGVTHEEFVDNYWFLNFIEQCEAHQIEVFGFNDFKKINYSPHKTKIISSASSGIDWFDVELAVTVGDEKVSLKEVRKSVIAGHKYLKLGSGKLALLPEEWMKRLENYFRIGKVTRDKLQISKQSFNVLEEVFEELNEPKILKEIREKKRKLKDFEKVNEVPLPEVNATLRAYQVKGYEWLHFLHEFGWGGILSDDMGLGKTLQVITFLKSLVDRGINKHLVVVPTSLLFNWQNEIEKFCPSLKYLIYHGASRDRSTESWPASDIILTSYGVLVSDFETFKDYEFDYCILDESQAIKNPQSKRYKAVVSIKASNRLAMTGTPIENNTFDLYAQMTFVNPGLFVSVEHFRTNFANAIDKYGDQKAAAELNRLIAPFILRRTKELVAKELPPKTESVIYCEMEKAQRRVYDAYRNEYRNEIVGMIDDQGLEKSKMHILQALTKLRQVCNSPALLSDEENYGGESAKINELVNHIREKTGRHKLLIFSQFVGMLQLIRQTLVNESIAFSYLDGQTSQKKRKTAVDDFQGKEDVRVFLISLKAGGTGLNLTAADYVYIVDPWWNPAVENQAIDRCYRIGQDKKVIAYRMICKDTLEEKIMDYKTKKQSVADAIVTTDENVMKQLNKDDMLRLFE
ncbi:MAG: DEAD/DEAH box helicase [Cyclobacteriaceae bacterium]